MDCHPCASSQILVSQRRGGSRSPLPPAFANSDHFQHASTPRPLLSPPVPGPTGSTGRDLEHASRCHWRAVADALVLFSPACVEGWNGTFNMGGRSVRIRKERGGIQCHLDQNGTSQTRRNANSAPMRHTLLELKTCSESL